MNYIKQKHSRLFLLGFLASIILLFLFPGIDLQVSSLFFNNGFTMRGSWWESFLHDSVPFFLTTSVIAIIGLSLYNKFAQKNLLGMDVRKMAYLLLVLILGSGLIVNALFKDHFGRARPRDVIEFNGSKEFTPVFVISQQCEKNCSFSSGHGAGAFFSLAFAFVFRHKRIVLVLALVYGSLVSLSRIAAGAHFFSDNITSFFVMLITSDVLYYYFFSRQNQNLANELSSPS